MSDLGPQLTASLVIKMGRGREEVLSADYLGNFRWGGDTEKTSQMILMIVTMIFGQF